MKFFKHSLLTACILLAAASCFSQDYTWGVGLRAGDPMGITVKKYLLNDRALELSFGRSHIFRKNNYWNNRYRDGFKDEDYCEIFYTDCKYLGYDRSAPIGFQLHYLIHKDIPIKELEGLGLQWYYGFGVQLSIQTYSYDFKYKLNGGWIYDTGGRTTDLDLGVDGVIGLEYLIPGVPISVFIDFTLFIEIVDNPFRFWPQTGTGGRYNF